MHAYQRHGPPPEETCGQADFVSANTPGVSSEARQGETDSMISTGGLYPLARSHVIAVKEEP